MKTKRIISLLLAVFTLMGSFVITVGATDSEEKEYVYTSNTTNKKPTINYIAGTTIPETEGANGVAVNTADKKLATMDLKLAKDGYLLYIDAYSGEVAVVSETTGESLFTNPVNIGNSSSANTEDRRAQLMSQLVVSYQDLSTGTPYEFYSFEECADRGQIDVKNIKNGIRVEYTIGREEARMLVPGQIKKETFERKILAPLAVAVGEGTYKYRKIADWYRLYDPSTTDDPTQMNKDYPITKKMAVYVLDANITDPKKALLEQDIKTHCPEYSYEDLDADHMEAEYESEDKDPPRFKMALEYTLDEYGLTVRLPANGIRFNESLYQLEKIEVLPYMGAGANPNPGYTFFPDGSGALFDFERIESLGMPVTIKGTIYGQDFAYHSITQKHEETVRYPVFGLVETQTIKTSTTPTPTPTPTPDDSADGGVATAAATTTTTTKNEYEKDRGFVAIVEEGDALMDLYSFHAVKTDVYNTVKMSIFPRPKDTYNIADAISVGNNSTWTVVSSRKYTGNYKVRYILLTDPDVAAEKGIEEYYDCSYVGMAKAYRDYLEDKGYLTRLSETDVKKDIPLYIETFGAIQTTKRVLSIPVTTMAPLTSFENIKTMYNDLSEKGVTNVNFILNGYTDGGMSDPSIPYKLKWDDAVGGKDGFEDLLAYAKEKDFGIFPEVDFVFITGDKLFDGLSLKKHAVKTIDNRYTSKRVYSATKQTHISYFELAVSPAYFSRFYEKFTENYLEYDPMGISVSTLGAYLNSDFDEDEPYNRGDAKDFTVEAFAYLDSKYDKVMTSGGNAFTWKYVDYIRDIALDSSRFAQSSAAVPFLGLVLHGYVQIAGSPINMEGNTDYALLKAIENGASLNFMLSYQNTNILKESEYFSQYYSVRYDIWFNDVVAMYSELNSLLADVQTSVITDHQFIVGTRVPDADEILADAKADTEAAIKLEEELAEAATKEEIDKLLNARKDIYTNSNEVEEGKLTVAEAFDKINGYKLADHIAAYKERLALDKYKADLEEKKKELKAIDAADTDAIANKQAEIDAIEKEINAIAAADMLKTLKSDKEKLVAEYDKLKASIEAVAPEMVDKTIDELKAKKSELEQAITDERAKGGDADQEKIAGWQQELQTITSVIATKESMEIKQTQIDAKQAEIDAENVKLAASSNTYGAFEGFLPADAATGLKNVQTDIDSIYYYANEIANTAYLAKAYCKISAENLQYLKDKADEYDDDDIEYSQDLLDDLAKIIEDMKVVRDELVGEIENAEKLAKQAYDKVKDVEGVVVNEYELPSESDVVIPDEDEDTDGEGTDGGETDGGETDGEDTDGDETDGDETDKDADGEENTEEEDEDDDHSKYTSNENKIVLVTYENGISFILNFNNFAITTVVNGVQYTVNGYDYIMFTK